MQKTKFGCCEKNTLSYRKKPGSIFECFHCYCKFDNKKEYIKHISDNIDHSELLDQNTKCQKCEKNCEFFNRFKHDSCASIWHFDCIKEFYNKHCLLCGKTINAIFNKIDIAKKESVDIYKNVRPGDTLNIDKMLSDYNLWRDRHGSPTDTVFGRNN